jgi:multidrug resistance protein MdtO
MKQKLAHRLAGAIVGGLLLGLGSIVFLFPHMDSVTALSGLVAAVAFIAAWSAAGRRFGYIGLQIAFSFFAVTLGTSSAPTELAPARDRLVGVGLALVIMWFVFDQVWPVRTITMMRQALASVLRGEAQLLAVAGAQAQSSDLGSRIDGLRHDVSARIAEMRNLQEAVLYEFGVDHKDHKAVGETMLRAALSSGSLFWNELAVLERTEDRYLLRDEELLNIRSTVAKQLETMAEAVVGQNPVEPLRGPSLDGPAPTDPRRTEYLSTLLSRYKEVESILLKLPARAQTTG